MEKFYAVFDIEKRSDELSKLPNFFNFLDNVYMENIHKEKEIKVAINGYPEWLQNSSSEYDSPLSVLFEYGITNIYCNEINKGLGIKIDHGMVAFEIKRPLGLRCDEYIKDKFIKEFLNGRVDFENKNKLFEDHCYYAQDPEDTTFKDKSVANYYFGIRSSFCTLVDVLDNTFYSMFDNKKYINPKSKNEAAIKDISDMIKFDVYSAYCNSDEERLCDDIKSLGKDKAEKLKSLVCSLIDGSFEEYFFLHRPDKFDSFHDTDGWLIILIII